MKNREFKHDPANIFHTSKDPKGLFLFKKKGGKRTVCFQSHIAEGTISVFSDIDILLKFGKEKEKLQRSLGGISEMKKTPDLIFTGII